eukprot:11126739-Lingulodinium_polyedra.AAC.1
MGKRARHDAVASAGQGVCTQPGPRSLDEVLSWLPEAVRRVLGDGPPCRGAAQKAVAAAAGHGLVLTSSFSGVGTFEASAVQALRTLQEETGHKVDVTCYSATEVEPVAQAALLAHDARSRP